jgi:hypothetical protein
MFVVFKCLLVGLITQNSDFLFRINKNRAAILKRYSRPAFAGLQKKSCSGHFLKYIMKTGFRILICGPCLTPLNSNNK